MGPIHPPFPGEESTEMEAWLGINYTYYACSFSGVSFLHVAGDYFDHKKFKKRKSEMKAMSGGFRWFPGGSSLSVNNVTLWFLIQPKVEE